MYSGVDNPCHDYASSYIRRFHCRNLHHEKNEKSLLIMNWGQSKFVWVFAIEFESSLNGTRVKDLDRLNRQRKKRESMEKKSAENPAIDEDLV